MKNKTLMLVVTMVVALLAAFWAGYTVHRIGTPEAQKTQEPVWVEATEGSIGRAIALSIEVTQSRRAVAVNRLQGTLTARSAATEFSVGDAVYAVDGVSVRVIRGDIPFYRNLGLSDSGEDVRQLNKALKDLGYHAGAADIFTDDTAVGYSQWQKDQGRQTTGTMRLGDLVAVPTLPTRLYLSDDDFPVGTVLAGGEQIVFAVAGQPKFSTVLTQQQVALIPEGTPVTVPYSGKTWKGTIGSATPDGQGVIRAAITASEGLLCGVDCAILPPEERIMITGSAEVVPAQTGVLVPIGAITFDDAGSTSVGINGPDGVVSTPVNLLGSQDGLALVDGIEAGTRVLVGEPARERE
ncbi:peptidoglycan-binding domain-containing protein [Trueperella pyogenes]|uniref:hypothetical protein n=1 Tax=Trueperella pyogenes TaxID=1661 RepID=UPI00345D442B